jgi:hypothetical protein
MKKEPWQGPHEGIEYELMTEGNKPAAYIHHDGFNPQWEGELAKGTMIAASIYLGGYDKQFKGTIIVKAGQQERLNRIIEEFTRDYRDHFRLGLLLGYCLNDVRKFMQMLDGRYS